MVIQKKPDQHTIKAIIYGYQRVPVGVLQRYFLLSYQEVDVFLSELMAVGLLNATRPYTINWQHPEWQNVAQNRTDWEVWSDSATQGCYRIEKQGQQWCVIHDLYFYQTVIAHVENEMAGWYWLLEQK